MEALNQVLGAGSFGMSDSKLDIKALHLLAKIDARQSIAGISESSKLALEKLRKFKLVSSRGRLMPKGVKLVRMLKRRGLMEKLREPPI